ncbi:MAG: hypothetical protein Q8O22_05560 [Candidatus Omnitrophota bacterium]|nr:hypothetical protein [Candidatus Omnitrophota bacterium]
MKIKLNTKIYPLEAVINACYEHLDRAYFYLDGDVSKTLIVHLKPKTGFSAGKLKNDFLNDLIFTRIRYQVSQRNKKITEYTIKRALYSAAHPYNNKAAAAGADSDPLSIAIPWENKYGRRKKRAGSRGR